MPGPERRRLKRLLYALRVAHGRQLRARAANPLRRRRFPRPRGSGRFTALDAPFWRSPAFAASDAVAGEAAVTLLGKEFAFPPPSWQLPGEPRLRRFHLHYGEEVLGWARRGDVAAARAGIEAWIAANPPREGDAWHPYPLSTRVGNWIAALSLEPELASSETLESLRRQLARLEHTVEDDVLGNHVIRNARALVLGGSALGEERLAERGIALLRRELPEQVLPDGGHYERSPVYHLVVLRDLMELRAAAGLEWLEATIESMQRFAAALMRPDGRPALFNDGALDIAPALPLPDPPAGLAVFPDTGYAVLRQGGTWLAFDCGPPAPAYLPAHAHADALSLQVWVEGRGLLVDPGTYTYEPGATRDYFRGTRAHSTITVDDHDQFELWGAFRSGPLPSVRLEGAASAELTAVAAYRGVRHARTVRLDAETLRIDDTVDGRVANGLDSRLVAAPGIELSAVASGAEELPPEQGWVSERFAERVPTSVRRAYRRRSGEVAWRVELQARHKVSP